MNTDTTKYITIGRFSKPFGVYGYIKVYSYSGESTHFKKIKKIFVGKTMQEYVVEDWLLNNPIRCKLECIHNPEEVKVLSGLDIFVERKYAVKLHTGEYYLADLEGLKVMNKGKQLGQIEGVITDAYAPLFDITWNSQKNSYVPFIKEFFEYPSIKDKTIELLMSDLQEI